MEQKVTKEIKDKLADTALSLLKEGVDYKSLAYTTVDFAYIYVLDSGIEAMFKVKTDVGTYAFGANKSKLMLLNSDFLKMYDDVARATIELHNNVRFN